MSFIASQVVSKAEKESIAKVFNTIDQDGNGKLSKNEIKAGFLEYFGTELSDAECDEIFRNMDVDNSGGIDYNEFIVGSLD